MILRTNKTTLKIIAVVALVALIVAVGAFTFVGKSAATHAQSTALKDDGIGTPKYVTLHGNSLTKAAAKKTSSLVDTIPFWSSAFTYANNLYPYQMVGTDPSAGSATTNVPTAIIPINLAFSDGVTLEGSKKLALTRHSPIFQKANFTTGFTQYGDAIQRAEWWKVIQASGKQYHVLLDQPTIYPTVYFNVPPSVGQEKTGARSGAPLGLISIDWFDVQLQNLLSRDHISPKVFPIFLTYNTFLYQGDPSNCCILGYHNAIATNGPAGRSQIRTYAFASYSDPGIFSAPDIQDIHALSHEVAEWLSDPFTDNATPTWSSPIAPQYGCNNFLEVGDPLVGVGFLVNGYHPQDEAFFSFFAKQVPSVGYHGQYTYLNTFSGPSPTC